MLYVLLSQYSLCSTHFLLLSSARYLYLSLDLFLPILSCLYKFTLLLGMKILL